jgi:hypothetical protein
MTAPIAEAGLLLIEDDPNKERAVLAAVHEVVPPPLVTVKRSYQTGLAWALREKPRVVVLDMTLPTWDYSSPDGSGRMRVFGGREILHQLSRHGSTSRVVVVTQFESFGDGHELMTLEELDRKLRGTYRPAYRGVVFYDPSGAAWREPFVRLLTEAVQEGP